MVALLDFSCIFTGLFKKSKFIKMKKGKVKFFNNTKGFGFINDDETGQDVFVHLSGLKDDIREGDSVTYEVTQGKKGLNAVNVQIAS
jgi:CspA family cold shock protein